MFPSLGPKIEKLIGKEQELLDAARTGNAEGIEKLIANKLTRKSTVGAKLQSFFKSVNINCRDKNGYTPLHHAVLNGHQNVVTLLLHYEAQPNVVDNQGCNPVHLAAWSGNQEILRLLLSAGTMPDDTAVEPVHVNQQSGSGDTALHCAAQYGHVEVVDVLLQRQANPNIRNLTEASPLDLAAQYGHIKVVNLLLMSHPELVQRPSCTQSPLHLAASNGHRDIVALLLDNKFNIQTMTEAGTCLHQAALHGKLDVVKLLLDRGIDVHCVDQQGNTALMLVEDHQTKQKSYSDITRAIKEHIARTEGVPASEEIEDTSVYEALATCSSGHSNQQMGNSETKNAVMPTKSPTLVKPRSGSVSEEKTPERPVPKKRPSFKTPPEVRQHSSPPYATVNKEKSGALESVSTSSSHPPIHSPPPPPLPPRLSVIPKEDALSNSDLSGVGQADALPDHVKPIPKVRSLSIPKKPPRQKKSPAMQRRSPPNLSDQCPDSPMSSPKSTTSIPDSDDVQKTFDIPEKASISKDTDQKDVATKALLHSNPNFDQSGATTESKSDQSNVVTPPSSKTVTSPVSPKPELPPKTRLSSAKILDAPKMDNSVDPVTGKQVNQSFYLEMKSPETSPIKQMVSTSRNDAVDSLSSNEKSDTKIDHYGILFPKFKNGSPSRSKKAPPLTRSQTAPEENIYVGHAPSATLLREKEKVLQRSNTVPSEDQSTLPLPPLPISCKEGTVEPEYSEIPEKSPPVSPSSPTENVYSTIAEVQGRESVNSVNSNVEELSTLKSEVTEETNVVTKGKESEGDSECTESCEAANSVKPNYLDFLKRNSATPLTPTGYPQPPTPDFPPPSPATAMMGIELKIQEMD